MSVFRQLACAVRGGHRWKTLTDVEGSVTYCVRCDKTRHDGTDFDPEFDSPGNPRGHHDANKLVETGKGIAPP